MDDINEADMIMIMIVIGVIALFWSCLLVAYLFDPKR